MTTKLVFAIQGSDPEPYTVIFQRNGANFTGTCTCQAGSHGQLCKHRIRLLGRNSENLISENESDLEHLQEMINGTDVEKALYGYFECERNCESAKAELERKKRALIRAMND